MRRRGQKFSSEALFGTCGLLLAVVGFVCLAPAAQAVRIKDVCSIEGMRDNHLVGYGLVVGLRERVTSARLVSRSRRWRPS